MPRNRKQRPSRVKTSRRVRPPLIGKVEGNAAVLCPFCKPPHPILADREGPCGTRLELRAIQVTYENVVCTLCGKSGGTLVRVGDRYRHTYNCSPGKYLYATPPKKSILAGILFKMPDWTHLQFARMFGKVAVEFFDANGRRAYYTWEPVGSRTIDTKHARQTQPISGRSTRKNRR